jgi:hypothetical protein
MQMFLGGHGTEFLDDCVLLVLESFGVALDFLNAPENTVLAASVL